MISVTLGVLLKPSLHLRVLVMAAHSVAMFALAWLYIWWAWLGVAVVLMSAGYYYARLKSPWVTAIEAAESGYRLLDRGVWRSVKLKSAFITAPLTVVWFKGEQGELYHLTLLRDSLGVDDYRRLRIHLRWHHDKP
jgi:hypothetical protein